MNGHESNLVRLIMIILIKVMIMVNHMVKINDELRNLCTLEENTVYEFNSTKTGSISLEYKNCFY